MAIEAAAGALVSGLLVPIVKSGVDAVAEQIGSALGDSAAAVWREKAKGLWQKVRATFSSGSEKVVIEEFENAPDRQDAQLLLKLKLADKLAEDPQLASELQELLGTLESARAQL